jgi:uncharacterized protein (TIGR02147 family)
VDQAALEKFSACASYRDFLSLAVERAGGCSAFSRRAGFSSRSFLSEVIRGHRRLSHSSYEKVSKGLKLTGDLRRLFQLLVAAEEPDVVRLIDQRNLREKIEQLRKKVAAPPVKEKRNLFASEQVPVVYAALGSRARGSSLAEILSRTRLTVGEAKKALQFLQERGVVELKTGRYFAQEGDIDLFELGGERGFREAYASSSDHLKKLALTAQPSEANMFFHCAFPIPRAKIAAFKQEVRELLLAKIDQHQAEEGDSVVRLNLGYFS